MQNHKDNFSISEKGTFFDLAMFSSIGNRSEQQDSSGYEMSDCGAVVVVCDGMGGHDCGKLISTSATEAILEQYKINPANFMGSEYLMNLLQSIDGKITSLRMSDGSRIQGGTTCVLLVITEEGIRWASAGDSRLYLFRDGTLTKLTTDHIYQNRLDRMLENSEISRTDYEDKSKREGEILTSFLGVGGLSEICINREIFQYKSNDEYLLASDGLYKFLDEKEVTSILGNFTNVEDALRALEAKVKRNNRDSDKRRDNMTLALVKMR